MFLISSINYQILPNKFIHLTSVWPPIGYNYLFNNQLLIIRKNTVQILRSLMGMTFRSDEYVPRFAMVTKLDLGTKDHINIIYTSRRRYE